jgi:hypothetical protein
MKITNHKSQITNKSQTSIIKIGHWKLAIGHFALLFLPHIVRAQTCIQDIQEGKLCSPIGQGNIATIIGFFIKTIIPISGAVALLMLIVGAIKWILSAGNPEKVKAGKDTVVWAILGSTVILGSYVALSFILRALTSSAPGYQ